MTREILFRGKRIDNGEWLFGDLRHIFHGEYRTHIVDNSNGLNNDVCGLEVASSTVGRFTGLTDKNGVKIFEGDIVRHEDAVSYIVWNPDNLRFEFAYKGNFRESISAKLVTVWGIEVIGNIYDNGTAGGEQE